MFLGFFDDFFFDFSVLINPQDPTKSREFTIENPIVNFMNSHGSWCFVKIEKSQTKSSKNHRNMIIVFLHHLKRLKNVHSFLQLGGLAIKISDGFQETAPLHGPSYISCSREQLLERRSWSWSGASRFLTK